MVNIRRIGQFDRLLNRFDPFLGIWTPPREAERMFGPLPIDEVAVICCGPYKLHSGDYRFMIDGVAGVPAFSSLDSKEVGSWVKSMLDVLTVAPPPETCASIGIRLWATTKALADIPEDQHLHLQKSFNPSIDLVSGWCRRSEISDAYFNLGKYFTIFGA